MSSLCLLTAREFRARGPRDRRATEKTRIYGNCLVLNEFSVRGRDQAYCVLRRAYFRRDLLDSKVSGEGDDDPKVIPEGLTCERVQLGASWLPFKINRFDACVTATELRNFEAQTIS